VEDEKDQGDKWDVDHKSITIVDHGYHDCRQSALFPNNANDAGSEGTSNDLNPPAGEVESRAPGAIRHQSASSASAFIYHIQDNKDIKKQEDILVSKTSTIGWEDEYAGFDAETGTAIVSTRSGTEIKWVDQPVGLGPVVIL
jgi:hypothetical protein